jgi:hypothetical protein
MNKYTYNNNFKYKGQSINILVWNKDYKFPKKNLTFNK